MLIGSPGGYPRPASSPRDGDPGGFTLIEVLVAFTIAALMLAVLLHSFTLGIGGASRVEAYTEATLIAQSTMDEFGTEIPVKDGTRVERHEGRFLVTAGSRLFTDDVAPDITGFALAPFELTVSVTWQEGARQQSINLRTLRLGSVPQPPQSQE